MSITVRLWSKEDLQDIRKNKYPLKTTIFMNVKTFSSEEIAVYPYGLRKTYHVYFEREPIAIEVYATDDNSLKAFLRAEYDYNQVIAINRVMTNYREVKL